MISPLTLVMPLEDGVDLTKLVETLAGAGSEIDQALTKIATVHFARFVIFDASTPNMQPGRDAGPFRLAVITEYDGDFDTYIQDFVNNIGDVFDALLSFTADGQSLIKVSDHVAEFTEYIASHDASQHMPAGVQSLYCAYDANVQAIRAAFPPGA
jgi:hypothetical protein